MVRRVAHIAIAVSDIDAAAKFYSDYLGLRLEGKETVPHRKVTVGFINLGETKLELVQPESPDAPVAKFLAERGPGLHHICLEVENIDAEFERLKQAGVRIVDPEPQAGAGGTRAFFIHPRATGGVLIELSQRG